MSCSACSGSQRAISTVRIPAAPGTRTPLRSPETWASGAGISTASRRRSPWTRTIVNALCASPRCVCSTAFGSPVEPPVNSATARSDGARRAPLDRRPVRERRVRLDEDRGLEHAEHALDLDRAGLVVDRSRRSRRAASTRGRGAPLRGSSGAATPRRRRAGRPEPSTRRRRAQRRPRPVPARARSAARRGWERPTRHRAGGTPWRRGVGTSRGGGPPQTSGVRQALPLGTWPFNRFVPMKLRWISTVPAPMHSPRMSR